MRSISPSFFRINASSWSRKASCLLVSEICFIMGPSCSILSASSSPAVTFNDEESMEDCKDTELSDMSDDDAIACTSCSSCGSRGAESSLNDMERTRKVLLEVKSRLARSCSMLQAQVPKIMLLSTTSAFIKPPCTTQFHQPVQANYSSKHLENSILAQLKHATGINCFFHKAQTQFGAISQ